MYDGSVLALEEFLEGLKRSGGVTASGAKSRCEMAGGAVIGTSSPSKSANGVVKPSLLRCSMHAEGSM